MYVWHSYLRALSICHSGRENVMALFPFQVRVLLMLAASNFEMKIFNGFQFYDVVITWTTLHFKMFIIFWWMHIFSAFDPLAKSLATCDQIRSRIFFSEISWSRRLTKLSLHARGTILFLGRKLVKFFAFPVSSDSPRMRAIFFSLFTDTSVVRAQQEAIIQTEGGRSLIPP